MELQIIDNQSFNNKNYTEQRLPKAEYSYCTFKNCNFENSDISNNVFLECEFHDCNFSNVNLKHTTFNDVSFESCKLVGINFKDSNDFLRAFSFTGCNLSLSSFADIAINRTTFTSCKMHQVDFSNAEAKYCQFLQCDLLNAIFDNTNIEHSDLSSAYNFEIDPSSNKIKSAIFSKDNLIGLLKPFHIKVK